MGLYTNFLDTTIKCDRIAIAATINNISIMFLRVGPTERCVTVFGMKKSKSTQR